MVSCVPAAAFCFSSFARFHKCHDACGGFGLKPRKRPVAADFAVVASALEKPTKLVTFLGKGGSGKTTAAVLAAKYFADEGLCTCLVLHSQDVTADNLMGCKIGDVPSEQSRNLSAVRLKTTKMLLEPLARIKKADASVNLTQGVLDGVMGEELGILLGMDSVFSALELEKYINFAGRKGAQQKFDVVVYDGISTEETLRMIASAERARWYLRYVRNLAEKTDIGRFSAPSILKLASESEWLNSRSDNVKASLEIWDVIQCILERAASSFTDPSRFRCYLVIDPSRPSSVTSALRYWGCAIQAGIEVCGAMGFASDASLSSMESAKEKISPLAFAHLPYISMEVPIEWNVESIKLGKEIKDLLSTSNSSISTIVRFDQNAKTVVLFMPGFDKSEIRLYQFWGGAELLVEAGDQRRVIRLPSGLQGKVAGAKFLDNHLTITVR